MNDTLPEGTFEKAPTDRGKEFSVHELIQVTLVVPMYFANSHSSWQRGSNENTNRLLCEFLSKGADFEKVIHDEQEDALAKING